VAEVSKSGTPSLATVNPGAEHRITGLLAGEALAAGDACRINAADGRVYRASGAAAGANAKVRGFAAVATAVGEAVTLFHDVNVRYGAALSPGADLFVSGVTAGALADVASIGGTGAIGYVIDATRIRVFASRY